MLDLRYPALAAAALLLTPACSSVSAADLDTDSIWADISATASSDSSTSVSATFRRGALSTTFIDLTDDDTLTATNGEETKELEAFRLLGIVTYSTDFAVGAGGEEFEVSLERERDDGAPSSIARLPDPFTIDDVEDPSPEEEGVSRENDDLVISWQSEGTSGDFEIQLAGECIESASATAGNDASSVTIEAGTIKKKEPAEVEEDEEPEEIPDDCEITVTIDRRLDGDLDPAYGGGTVTGRQTRTKRFDSVP